MLATAVIKMTIDTKKNIDSTASISARVGKSKIWYSGPKAGSSNSLQFSTKQQHPLDRIEMRKIWCSRSDATLAFQTFLLILGFHFGV
jgi:hypothetical protein